MVPLLLHRRNVQHLLISGLAGKVDVTKIAHTAVRGMLRPIDPPTPKRRALRPMSPFRPPRKAASRCGLRAKLCRTNTRMLP